MKYITAIFLVTIFFVACKKNTPQNLLVGKWQLVTDSSSITGFLNNSTRDSIYIGTSNDYYDFTSNGKFFSSEAQSLDTATYTLSSGNQQVNFLYSYFGHSYVSGNVVGAFIITDLTTNHLTLTSELAATPEEYVRRVINLKR